ncbi:hypothetical protein ACFV20_19650 [Streptomyces sp. NPDC059696]
MTSPVAAGAPDRAVAGPAASGAPDRAVTSPVAAGAAVTGPRVFGAA